MHVGICCSIRFVQLIEFTATVLGNILDLSSYLPSLGKVKMVTQYAQIAWAGCLGVRR